MNRIIVAWGVILLVLSVGMMISPFVQTGTEQLDPLSEIGVFMLPVVVVVAFVGGLSPDPERLTVGGALGNADEAEHLARRPRAPEAPRAGHRSSPKEPVNCKKCYTLVPWDELYCPRCTTPRSCRGCGAELESVGGAIECTRCRRRELYCNCPAGPRASTVSEHTRRRAVR